MITIKKIIESKKEEIKDLYFEMLELSYKINYYTKCYIDNETHNLHIRDCITKDEKSYGEYKGLETLLFTIEPNDWNNEFDSEPEDLEYLISKEGLEDNDTQQEIFENLFNDLTKEASYEN